jgi:hypothetical protein
MRKTDLAYLLVSLFAVQTPATVIISTSPPNGSVSVVPNLVGFSLEQDRWTDWAGLNTRNEFLFNVLDNLRALSGVPPIIRIGADSEDHTNFNPNVQVFAFMRVVEVVV